MNSNSPQPGTRSSLLSEQKREGRVVTEKSGLRILFLYFTGCPNHKEAWRNLTETLGEHEIEASIERMTVETDREAKRLGFLGSPTIKVNGVDVETSARRRLDFGMSCRVYRVGGHILGSPSKEMIQRALEEQGRRNR